MDMYNIPGDTGGNWRLNKFVEYQHEVPSIHYRVLGEYIKEHISDRDDAVMMCWYMSCTYNEITCVFLQEILNWKSLNPENSKKYLKEFWKTYKEGLDFGSSRKYAKNMDWFPNLVRNFIKLTKKKPYKWLSQFDKENPYQNYKDIFSSLSKIPFTGRFSIELFMESVCYLKNYLKLNIKEPSKLDWKHCSNLTSGLMNIFYLDEEANEFDKTKHILVSEDELVEKLKIVQKAIKKVYPEQDVSINLFVGKICSFRNLFKASRYGGFHHDRELGVLKEYEKTFPEYETLWKSLYKLRKKMFPKKFLGEANDPQWFGIRKSRKKLWLEKGLTGVEEIVN